MSVNEGPSVSHAIFGWEGGEDGECLKCGKAGHRVYTQALFYTCHLCVFALTPPANLLHLLICLHFWFNTLGLVFLLLFGFFLFHLQLPP
jgi:hypothetical protein